MNIILVLILFTFIGCIENNSEEIKRLSQKDLRLDKIIKAEIIYSTNSCLKAIITGDTVLRDNEKSINFFTAGIFIKSYDSLKEVESILIADSAVYDEGNNVAKFYRNVLVVNCKKKDSMWAKDLIININQNSISTKNTVHIKTQTDNLTGTGFYSTLNLSNYTIVNPRGPILIRD